MRYYLCSLWGTRLSWRECLRRACACYDNTASFLVNFCCFYIIEHQQQTATQLHNQLHVLCWQKLINFSPTPFFPSFWSPYILFNLAQRSVVLLAVKLLLDFNEEFTDRSFLCIRLFMCCILSSSNLFQAGKFVTISTVISSHFKNLSLINTIDWG
jgi:hypothetical protein